jgi:hypothetical protein
MRPVIPGAGAGPGPAAGAPPGAAGGPGRWKDSPGRWIWAVSGVVTAIALTIPAVRLLTRGGPGPASVSPVPIMAPTRTFTVPQPVTALAVDSYGAPVRITAGPVSRVQVTETVAYSGKAGPPSPWAAGPGGTDPWVTDTVSGGRLTLAAPGCADDSGCSVTFILTVPAGTAADVDTDGGPLVVDGLAGSLTASSDGGFVDAQGLTSPDATVTTGGGPTVLGFGAAPRAVTVTTSGGSAQIGVPGGPYALTASSGGGLESVAIATAPAGRSLRVATGGGPLLIAPSVAGAARPVTGTFRPGNSIGVPPVPPVPPLPPVVG